MKVLGRLEKNLQIDVKKNMNIDGKSLDIKRCKVYNTLQNEVNMFIFEHERMQLGGKSLKIEPEKKN